MKPAIVKRVLNQLNLLDYHSSALYAFIQLWVFLFSYWRIRCVLSWTLPRLPFFFLKTHLLFLISHSLGWVSAVMVTEAMSDRGRLQPPWNGVYSQKFWTLNVLRCAQFDCGIFPRQDVRVPVSTLWFSCKFVCSKKTLRTFHHCHFSLSV